jgi:hypothetical protein
MGPAVRLRRHALHHRLRLGEARLDGHRQLRVAERGGDLLAQSPIGDLDPRRASLGELEGQLEQRVEGERRVARVRFCEFHVGETGLEADPHAAPGPIGHAIGAVHPHGHAEDAALPRIRGAPRQSHEASQHEGRNVYHHCSSISAPAAAPGSPSRERIGIGP